MAGRRGAAIPLKVAAGSIVRCIWYLYLYDVMNWQDVTGLLKHLRQT